MNAEKLVEAITTAQGMRNLLWAATDSNTPEFVLDVVQSYSVEHLDNIGLRRVAARAREMVATLDHLLAHRASLLRGLEEWREAYHVDMVTQGVEVAERNSTARMHTRCDCSGCVRERERAGVRERASR